MPPTRPLALLSACAALAAPSLALAGSAALVDAACDTDGDGVVDDLPSGYAEGQQYGNMLNFYAVTMGSSPLHAAAPLEPLKLGAGVELAYIPQLSCGERAVYDGYKTEHTNKSPVFPRLHLLFGLPYGAYAGVSGLPPVPAFGVKTGVLAGELGYGYALRDRLELGGRTALLVGKVVGDLAGPVPPQSAKDDSFTDRVWSIEGMAGYRIPLQQLRLTPYLGAGYTRVRASMHIGEDGVDVPGEQQEMGRMQYRGPHGEVGVQVAASRLRVTAEGYMVPLNVVDPGNPRFFLSPRLEVGYSFF